MALRCARSARGCGPPPSAHGRWLCVTADLHCDDGRALFLDLGPRGRLRREELWARHHGALGPRLRRPLRRAGTSSNSTSSSRTGRHSTPPTRSPASSTTRGRSTPRRCSRLRRPVSGGGDGGMPSQRYRLRGTHPGSGPLHRGPPAAQRIGSDSPLGLHAQNTRNTGFANAWTVLQSVDSSSNATVGGSEGARSRRGPPATSGPTTSSTSDRCWSLPGHRGPRRLRSPDGQGCRSRQRRDPGRHPLG